MAKLAVTVTVFFFLIALSHARFPVDLTENDVTSRDRSIDSTESDPKRTANLIFLPSDKHESKSEEVVVNEIETQKAEPDSSESKTTTTFDSVAVINFRPITRQFPGRPSLIFRHRRPCRHHAMRKPWVPARPGRPWFEKREVPYGNDMLTVSDAAGDNKAEHPRWFRDEQLKVHPIPTRWVNFHDGDAPRFPFKHIGDVVVMKKEGEEEFKRPRHDHHGHHHHHRHHHGEEEEREGHEHVGGLLKKIRKFLTHF